ncbi:hypothetical protein EJB05_42132, partial [Eragrostis curvula]
MAVRAATALALVVCLLCCYAPAPSTASAAGDFLKCLSESVPSQLVLTPSSPSFTSVLVFSAAVLCGRRHGVRLRVRSGGHDYEGLSYRSTRPEEEFAVVDLARLRAVRVDRDAATAFDSARVWGEMYFGAANFERLAITKGKADPDDYFRNEQSIPPLVQRN